MIRGQRLVAARDADGTTQMFVNRRSALRPTVWRVENKRASARPLACAGVLQRRSVANGYVRGLADYHREEKE